MQGRSRAWPGRLTSKVVEPRGDGDVLGLMIRYDLLGSFAGALGDLPQFVRLERGVLTYRVKVPVIPDKSWFVGFCPSGRHVRDRGWTMASATTVDHGAELPFCTRGSIWVSAHPACGRDMDRRFGGRRVCPFKLETL